MKKGLTLIGAAGLGAGLMYLFDPDRGKVRRAFLHDKAVHARRVVENSAGKTQRNFRNHLHGAFAELTP